MTQQLIEERAASLEHRAAISEIRAINDADHTFEIRVVNYNRPDTYGTNWQPGVFTDSLAQRMPSAVWSHDASRVIGSLKEYDEKADGVDGLVKFADFEHVPDARMAWSILKDGHIKDTSFGFVRQVWQRTDEDPERLEGETHKIIKARLDEVSPVLRGSVPGAGVGGVRSDMRLTRSQSGLLLARYAAGDISLTEAMKELGKLEGAHDYEPTRAADADSPCMVCAAKRDDKAHTEQRSSQDQSEQQGGEQREVEQIELRGSELSEALDYMELDGLPHIEILVDMRASVGEAKNPKGTAQLKAYWAHGEGAAKIKWGTAGDHTRCVRQLGKYVGPQVVHGLCTNIQKMAIGHAGNKTPAEKGRSDEQTETRSATTDSQDDLDLSTLAYRKDW